MLTPDSTYHLLTFHLPWGWKQLATSWVFASQGTTTYTGYGLSALTEAERRSCSSRRRGGGLLPRTFLTALCASRNHFLVTCKKKKHALENSLKFTKETSTLNSVVRLCGSTCLCEGTERIRPGVPMKHATYQIVLPIIHLDCFKGRFRVGVGMDIKKSFNPHE